MAKKKVEPLSKIRCPECDKEVFEKDVVAKNEEAYCAKCKQWFFYGALSTDRSTDGIIRKPTDVTQILQNEYNGTSDYHL